MGGPLEHLVRFRGFPLVPRGVSGVISSEILQLAGDFDRRWRDAALGIIFGVGIVIDGPEEVVV